MMARIIPATRRLAVRISGCVDRYAENRTAARRNVSSGRIHPAISFTSRELSQIPPGTPH